MKAQPDEDEGRPVSGPAAGCWLLVWQQPTDRALAGWCPVPGAPVLQGDEMTVSKHEAFVVRWMSEQLQMTGAELTHYRSAQGG